MAIEQLTNAAATTLDGDITATATTLDVTAATAFPANGNFRVIVASELMQVTGVSSDTFTVIRGIEGSTATTHSDGDAITLIITADSLRQMSIDATTQAISPLTTAGDLLTANPSTVTSLVVGFIGDSITLDVPSGGSDAPPDTVATNLTSAAVTVSVSNRGIGGTTTADWLPSAGTGYLTAAIAALAGDSVRLVHIMLGTNDATDSNAISASDYGANLQTICAALIAAGFTVALSYPPFGVAGSFSGDFSTASQTRLIAYHAEIDALIDGVRIYRGDAEASRYFSTHTGELSDGVHPGTVGVATLGRLWSAALRPIVGNLSGPQYLNRIPIGTETQILTVVGGLPAWATGFADRWEPVTDGVVASPSLVFSAGDVVMVKVT